MLNFSSSVTLRTAGVTKGTGSVSSIDVNGSQVTINLTGVTNAQRVFATLFGVTDGTNSNDITLPIGFLLADVNGNGVVTNSDVSGVKSQVGAALTSSSFRDDVNVNGVISNTDVSSTKSQVGTSLP